MSTTLFLTHATLQSRTRKNHNRQPLLTVCTEPTWCKYAGSRVCVTEHVCGEFSPAMQRLSRKEPTMMMTTTLRPAESKLEETGAEFMVYDGVIPFLFRRGNTNVGSRPVKAVYAITMCRRAHPIYDPIEWESPLSPRVTIFQRSGRR